MSHTNNLLELEGTPVTLPELEIVEDIEYVEGVGVLLSHVRVDKHDYLFLWCDCDGDLLTHRWALLRTNEEIVAEFKKSDVIWANIIPVKCLEDFVYFIDYKYSEPDNKMVVHRAFSLPIADFPYDYMPQDSSKCE